MPPAGPLRSAAVADPVLTANIYCADGLDQVVRRALLPFWRSFVDHDPGGECYLWFVRYARCGEHLKVRLHGPAAHRQAMERLLAAATATCLAELQPPPGDQEPRAERPRIPPIDAEDEAEVDYPDRTLLWTHYRRSHVSLGGKPLLDDDLYAALLTACLGLACDLVLAAVENAPFSHRLRQNTLLKSLIGGLALGFDRRQRAAYLAYHRDWLLRFTLVRNQVAAAKTQEFLGVFDRRAAAMAGTLEQLSGLAGRQWQPGGGAGASVERTPWQQGLEDLRHHLAAGRDDPDRRLDPFAADPDFPPLFKVFHGLANQLGLNMIDEAFAHHLLLRATSDEIHEPLLVALTAEALG